MLPPYASKLIRAASRAAKTTHSVITEVRDVCFESGHAGLQEQGWLADRPAGLAER